LSIYGARKFVRESYEKNDLIGKQLLIAYLITKGHTIKKETFQEDYGVDIVTEYQNQTYMFEVEMKDKYNFVDKNTFPFDTVSFLGRKEKWKKNGYFYCIISTKTNAAIFCHSDVIFDETYKQTIYIETIDRNGLDSFYRVPKDICEFRTPETFYKKNYKEVWDNLVLQN
jgi:hypothetical protein